jgi:type IV secretory pathway TraG/TraD family ATPase VirD4
MIHELLLKLNDRLPLYPPAVVVVAAAALIALLLWLLSRSKGAILLSLALGLLGLGLAVGLFGLDKPAAAPSWGRFEDLADTLIGPYTFRKWEQVTAGSVMLALGVLYLIYDNAFEEKPGEQSRRRLEQDKAQREALGSARLCSPRTFRRWRKHDPWGWTLRGQFWGAKGHALGKHLSLSGEDIARGVAVFGPQGSGKTQSVILPAIADRMRDGHSLIVTDVQGELQPYIEKMAALTGHALFVHNPSDPAGSIALNLCDWIGDVADAKAMASVLLSDAHDQGDPFWTRAAINLLAACALHYRSFAKMLDARQDMQRMAHELQTSKAPGVAVLAADFCNSLSTREPKLALSILATVFNVGLAAWADPELRRITSRTDLDLAVQLANLPTVLVLRCSRRHTDAYGPYLGTVLRVLVNRLDDLGERRGGALPTPVGLILEEFPALGRLDSLVRDINLVRKRRISILTAAQSLAQFDHLYPGRGEADRLLAGLATKIVFGGCDQRTAEFFSQGSGQQTLVLASASQSGDSTYSGATASLRSRALLLPDDLISPARGHATVFAAYSERIRASQAIFHAELTPFFKRKDWKLERVRPATPLTLIRSVSGQERDEPCKPQPEPTPGFSTEVWGVVGQLVDLSKTED